MRKIVLGEETWEYMIGKHNVVIKSPRDEKKSIYTLEKITGRTTEVIKKGRKNKTSDGSVGPQDIKNFILKNFPLPEDRAAQ